LEAAAGHDLAQGKRGLVQCRVALGCFRSRRRLAPSARRLRRGRCSAAAVAASAEPQIKSAKNVN
jgi:hypothetical protein